MVDLLCPVTDSNCNTCSHRLSKNTENFMIQKRTSVTHQHSNSEVNWMTACNQLSVTVLVVYVCLLSLSDTSTSKQLTRKLNVPIGMAWNFIKHFLRQRVFIKNCCGYSYIISLQYRLDSPRPRRHIHGSGQLK